MRFLVLPLSRTHSMLYCQRVAVLPLARATPRLDEKLETRAANTWDRFAKTDVGWRKKIVEWVDKMMATIPYEEWSLKGIPRKNKYLRKHALKEPSEKDDHVHVNDVDRQNLDVEPIAVHFPKNAIDEATAYNAISKLALEGMVHHRKYMVYCGIALPFTLPIAVLPVIPNLPGFYLLFRVWSHWKALQGAQHLNYLISSNHLEFVNDDALNKFFPNGEYLTEERAKELAESVGASGLEREAIRAIEQVKNRESKEAKAAKDAPKDGQ